MTSDERPITDHRLLITDYRCNRFYTFAYKPVSCTPAGLHDGVQ